MAAAAAKQDTQMCIGPIFEESVLQKRLVLHEKG